MVISSPNCPISNRYISSPRKEKFEGNYYGKNTRDFKRRKNSAVNSKKRSKRTRSRNNRKKSGSQGMTAAIILIAFIITAAGIAFVILTMGSSYAQMTQTIGTEGQDYASSSLQVVGGFITGYDIDADEKIEAVIFCMKLALDSGEVDLSSSA
ncbi:MAG: hypothetical protein GY870_21055, partial [archaeon]|nr:hypothetical protein [archaeon]